MRHSLLGLIELFVVFAFVLGWGVLELVAMRIDRRRTDSTRDPGHTEGQ